MRKYLVLFIMLGVWMMSPVITQSKEEVSEKMVNIEKENTTLIRANKQEEIKPSKQVKKMLKETDIEIENPKLIKLLNESTLNNSPFAFGYQASISLGKWPLHYTSEESSVHNTFQTININEQENNQETKMELFYNQNEKKTVMGALTKKVEGAEQIQAMILQKAKNQHDLPLSFEATIGKDTKLSQTYSIPSSKKGILKAHLPAVKDSGHIKLGEVVLEMNGAKTKVVLKNVTEQKIGAFLPIANHLTFTYETE